MHFGWVGVSHQILQIWCHLMGRKCIAKGVDINPYLLKFATDVKSLYGHQAALSWMSHLISHTLHSPGK